MTETVAPYTVTTAQPVPAVIRPGSKLPPIDPRLRLLLIAVRHAALILADGLAAYCELPDKGVR